MPCSPPRSSISASTASRTHGRTSPAAASRCASLVMSDHAPQSVRFGADGLAPVVVQDAVSGDVLMLAFMNEEALRLTHETGRAHYWSRSRDALWRKGETSGHEQFVDEIRVNCERNSLLLLVRQVGAVCHDGYPTCFYRRAGPTARSRSSESGPSIRASSTATRCLRLNRMRSMEIDPLAEATRRQFGAYAYLRDHDLTSESETSRRLRQPGSRSSGAVSPTSCASWPGSSTESIGTLAGNATCSSKHPRSSTGCSLESLRNGVTWMPTAARSCIGHRRPAAAGSDDWPAPSRGGGPLVRRTRAETTDVAASAHATLSLVGQACVSAGLDPLAAVQSDIVELESRPYLAPYFGHRTR